MPLPSPLTESEPAAKWIPGPGNTAVRDMTTNTLTLEEEYAKNPEMNKEDIVALREWVESQPNLPKIRERELILFHHSCYYKMEDTKSCINVFYNIRLNTPEFFDNRDMSLPQLQKAVQALNYGCLPVKDPNGYQIIFHGLREYEPSKYVFADGVKLLCMAAEACLLTEGSVPGYIFLFDMKGVRLGHLTRLSVSLLRKFFVYIQEGIPVRLKAIHVVNTLPIIDKIMFIIKPFMKKELMKLIHFHSSNYEEVQKFLPKNCLPSDFGGELDSYSEIHQRFVEWMTKLEDRFREDEEIRSQVKGSKKVNGESQHRSLSRLEID